MTYKDQSLEQEYQEFFADLAGSEKFTCYPLVDKDGNQLTHAQQQRVAAQLGARVVNGAVELPARYGRHKTTQRESVQAILASVMSDDLS